MIGEELDRESDIPVADLEQWKAMLQKDQHEMMTQKTQKEAIIKLTEMLNGHIQRYNNMGRNLQKELITMQGRVHALETKSKVLRKEMTMVFGNSSSKDLAEMNSHLAGLKTVLSKDGREQQRRLDKVVEAAK